MESQDSLLLLEAAERAGNISPAAAENIRSWLTNPKYQEFAPDVVKHLEKSKFTELNKAFWKVLEFGTGGRRGEMYPIGTAVINRRTMGESAAGLAAYVKARTESQANLACAIGYDTRHQSAEFARLCAEIMVAVGFKVYFLQGFHSTPCVSFTVRYKQCACGIMITASHNPPSDNGFKAYWENGGQLVPPHDAGVIECVMDVGNIAQEDFESGVTDGRIRSLPRRNRSGVYRCRYQSGVSGTAECQNHLFSAARCWQFGRTACPGQRWLCGGGGIWTAGNARW